MMISASTFICFFTLAHQAGGFSISQRRYFFAKPRVREKVAVKYQRKDMWTIEDGEVRELLDKREVVAMNSFTSQLSSTLPGVMEIEVYPEEGTVIFEKGDKSDGFYFVKTGNFECVDDDGMVFKVFEKGDIFGEIGIFLGEPRSLTVRSASPNASSWFVSSKKYNLICQLNDGAEVVDYQDLLKDNYTDYMNFRSKRAGLRAFKAFKEKITNDDMDRVAQTMKPRTYEVGEHVINQGDEGVCEMYFIENGSFEAYDEDLGKVVKNYNKTNAYFGELGLFLNRPRTKSVCASTPGTLWVLSRDDLFDIVDKDKFEGKFLEFLADEYRDLGLIDKYMEVVEYLEFKSRPKKKPVSAHSTVSIVASGAYLSAYQPFFHPGFDKDGFLQVFDFYQPLSMDACHQIQLSVCLFAICGVMGFFRIPPNAPAARRLPFTLASLANVFFALTLSSSLNALPEGYWLFDAFSPVGTVLIGFCYLLTASVLIMSFDNAICGSEKGMESTPGAMGRGSNIFFASLIYFFVNTAQVPFVTPIFFSTLTDYQSSMSVAFQEVGLPALDFHSFATAVGFVSFLQLLATLQFGKKISEAAGLAGFVTLFVVFNCDAITATYKTIFRPELLPILEKANNYLPDLIERNYLIETGLGVTGLVVLNAVAKTLMEKKSD